jgi:hypothetical protein
VGVGQGELLGGGLGGEPLEAVPQPQEVGVVAAEFAGQLGRAHPLGEAAQDEQEVAAGLPGTVQAGAGEGVEDAATALTLVVEDGVAAAAVDAQAVGRPAAGAAEPAGVEEPQEAVVAGALVQQVGDREVHGQPPAGDGCGYSSRQAKVRQDAGTT